MMDFLPPIVTYIWLVIRHFMTIIVMYGIYTYARNDFERLIVCSLVLIYIAVSEFSRACGMSQMLNMAFMKQEIDKLRDILTKRERAALAAARTTIPLDPEDDPIEWEREAENEELDLVKETINKTKVATIITASFHSIAFFLTLAGILIILMK